MRRRIQRNKFGSPVVNDVSQNNAIFHVRTHHEKELSGLSKGTTENPIKAPSTPLGQQNRLQNIWTTARLSHNGTDNTPSATGITRRTRREVSLGTFAPNQTKALLPARQHLTNHTNDHHNSRFKIQITEDKSGERPTKILATLSKGASLKVPEGLVKFTRSSFHTPTIREIGSNEDLCQLNNDQNIGTTEPMQMTCNLWNETAGNYPNNTNETVMRNSNNWNEAAIRNQNNWNEAAIRNQNNWNDAVVRKPRNWNGAVVANQNNWKEALMKNSNNWNKAVIRNSYNWNEALANNPNRWTEAAVRNSSHWNEPVRNSQNNWNEAEFRNSNNWKGAVVNSPSNWNEAVFRHSNNWNEVVERNPNYNRLEAVMRTSDNWSRNRPREQQRKASRHRSSSRRHNNCPTGTREREKDWKIIRRKEVSDFHDSRPQSPPDQNPSSKEDSLSPSDSDEKSEDTVIRNNETRLNLYGSQTYHTREPERYPRSAGILKAPTPNDALTDQSNNISFNSPNYYARPQSFASISQIRRPFKPRCPTCHFIQCATCKCSVCVDCMAISCACCGAPLCSACNTASCATYSIALCTACIYSQYMAFRAQPYPAIAETKFPLRDRPPYSPYNIMPPSYSPFSSCSPYIDWAARCNLPPLIPNFVCETALDGPCETPPGDICRAPPGRRNKFLELFSKRQDNSSEDCSTCWRGVNQPVVYSTGWARRVPAQSVCNSMCYAHDSIDCDGLFHILLNIIWVVVPVILSYVLAFHVLTHLIALNKFTRVTAVLASTTFLYILSLEPDDLIVYPTDRPKVQQTRRSLLAACAPCPAPPVFPSPSPTQNCKICGPDICPLTTVR